MIPAALLGIIGLASVASARSDTFRLGPLPSALGVLAVFLAMHLTLRLRARYADPYLLPTVGVLVALGLVELDRISPQLAADQAVWIAVGGVAFIATLILLPDHRVLEHYTYLIGLLGVGLLVATMLFGTRIYGAKLWIEIGGGQTVQLGEVSKILIVIFLAAYLRDKRELLAIPTGRVMGVPVPPMAALGPVLVFLGACLALVVVLNDFGTALLFLGIFLAMIYLATGRAAYTVFGLLVFVVGSTLVYTVVPRIQVRVNNWLRPFDDAQGQGYQLVQSLYALAQGGVVGPGLGKAFLVTDERDARDPGAPDRLHVLGGGQRPGVRRRRRPAAGLHDLHPARVRHRGPGQRRLLQAARGRPHGGDRPAGDPDHRRRHATDPAHRRHPALPELRRIERRHQLRAGGPAADHQPPLPGGQRALQAAETPGRPGCARDRA